MSKRKDVKGIHDTEKGLPVELLGQTLEDYGILLGTHSHEGMVAIKNL